MKQKKKPKVNKEIGGGTDRKIILINGIICL